MSVSTLAAVEKCPRAWALLHADYEGLGAGSGYPQLPSTKSIEGTLVHKALETILRALALSGVESLSQPGAVGVLRELGGISVVLTAALDQTLVSLDRNPRSAHLVPLLGPQLRSELPRLRGVVQAMLNRVRVIPSAVRPAEGPASAGHRALPLGSYNEALIEAPSIGWKGIADLLVLDAHTCEIVDFKSGAPSDDHAFQLHAYAAMWRRDRARNPQGRTVTALRVVYGTEAQEIQPLPDDGDDELASEMAARAEDARTAVSSCPPEARVEMSRCCRCQVRQLCDAYWAQLETSGAEDCIPATYFDVELMCGDTSPSGLTTATVVRAHGLASGTPVLLKWTGGAGHSVTSQLIRVLGVRAYGGDESSAVVLSMSDYSECLLV